MILSFQLKQKEEELISGKKNYKTTIDKPDKILYYKKALFFGSLAQAAEHLTFNQGVRRSSRR